MGSSTTIHAFPELLALAEEEAESAYEAMVSYSVAHPYDQHGRKRSEADPWAQLPAGTREWWVGARLLLLCDLTRPASRDAVCRLIATHQNVDVFQVHRTLQAARDVPEFAHLTHAEQFHLVVRHLWPEEVLHG